MMLVLANTDIPRLALDPATVRMLAWALGGYVLFLLAISIYASRRVQTEADYLVAGRRLPLFLAWGTLIATWFGAATMFAAAGQAREVGLLGVVLDPLACAGTLVLAGIFFARPLWKMELYTMADFYRVKYGPAAEVVGACIQVPSYFAWVALQYMALAKVLELYFGIPLAVGIVVVAAVTLTYTMIGGMWSVTLTDTFQIVMPAELKAAALLPWLAAWATGLFGNIPGQDLQQRVFASKSPNVAMQACILAGVLYLVFGMIPVTLGLASLVTHPNGTLDPVGFLAGENLSPGMLVVFMVAVVSMVVSTATSAVLAPATILGHNLLSRIPGLDTRPLFRDRACVVIVSLGGICLAMWGKSLMELLDVALSIQLVALFVPVVMGIYGRPRGQLPAVLSMLMGLGAWLVTFVIHELAGETSAGPAAVITAVPSDFWGLGCGMLGYLIGQTLSPARIAPGTGSANPNKMPCEEAPGSIA